MDPWYCYFNLLLVELICFSKIEKIEENRLCQPFFSMQETLCGCCSDCGICCLTIWCPMCQASLNWAHSRDDECDCCHCLMCVHPLWTRDNIRKIRHSEPSKCGDCCVYCFCAPCAICQDAREINRIKSERVHIILPFQNSDMYNSAIQISQPAHPPRYQQNQQPYYGQQYQVPPQNYQAHPNNYQASPIPPYQQNQYQQSFLQGNQQPIPPNQNIQPNTYSPNINPEIKPNDD